MPQLTIYEQKTLLQTENLLCVDNNKKHTLKKTHHKLSTGFCWRKPCMDSKTQGLYRWEEEWNIVFGYKWKIQSSYTLILAARVYNVHTLFKVALCCDCSLLLACVFYTSPFHSFFIFPPTLLEKFRLILPS